MRKLLLALGIVVAAGAAYSVRVDFGPSATASDLVGIDEMNSSDTELAGAASFTGVGIDLRESAVMALETTIYADVAGTAYVQTSDVDSDANYATVATLQIAAGQTLRSQTNVSGRWARVKYTNGATAQGYFTLATRHMFSKAQPATSGQAGAGLGVPVSWPGLEVSKGTVPGTTSVHKFGARASVINTGGTIWEGATAHYTGWLTAADEVRVKAGGNVADTAAGAGAREVTIVGLDETWTDASEAVATNGGLASLSTTTTFIRVFRAYVSSAGTYATGSAGGNTGDITIEIEAGTADVAIIKATRGQTEMALYTVPDGYTGYILATDFNVEGPANQETSMAIYQRTDADDTSAPLASKRLLHSVPKLSGAWDHTWHAPFMLPGKTDVWVEGTGPAGGAAVSATFDIILVLD